MAETVPTIILTTDPTRPDPAAIEQAAAVLRAGRLVAFPTETVYGLGANALSAAAIDRIYWAKQRPANDPIIAHIHDVAQLATLAVNVSEAAYKLAESFWPGPLTLVLRRADVVPANIAAGLDTVAVRMPSHDVARALLAAADLPVAAPSANTFTRPSATTAGHVMEDLDGRVDLILDAGPTTIGLESTVIDMTGDAPVVLRPGGATLDALRSVLPGLQLSPRYVTDEATTSPGQMLKHYSPRARVIAYTGDDPAALLTALTAAARAHVEAGRKVGVLVADQDRDRFAGFAQTVRLGDGVHEISRRLFAALRDLDHLGVDVILVRDFGREGLGAAIWDRLLRAAEGDVVTVQGDDSA